LRSGRGTEGVSLKKTSMGQLSPRTTDGSEKARGNAFIGGAGAGLFCIEKKKIGNQRNELTWGWGTAQSLSIQKREVNQ